MKITVITVAYNSAKTLEDTIMSVLRQSYKNIEYIVIDGGSQDGSQDIIKKYVHPFQGRLKWISEKDGGIYDAMNKGIRMATGEVVGFLNSDDYYSSDSIVERIAESFSSPMVDAVYGDIHFIHDDDPTRIVRYYSSRHFSPFWVRFGFMPAHPSFYVRRNIYEKNDGYRVDYKIGADFEMLVRLFRIEKIRAKYIPLDFVTMRVGGVSTKNIRSRRTLLRENVRACRENGIYTNYLMVALKYLYKMFEFRV